MNVLQELGGIPSDFSIQRDHLGDFMDSSLYPGLPFLATLKRMDVMHLDLYSE